MDMSEFWKQAFLAKARGLAEKEYCAKFADYAVKEWQERYYKPVTISKEQVGDIKSWR